jgi:hypothetical protein
MILTSITVPLWAPPGLAPELARLVDAGVLARAARDDGAREAAAAFDELGRATRRGELTVEQASALAALLGLGASRPANDG